MSATGMPAARAEFLTRRLPWLALALVVMACIANRCYWYAPETAYRGYSPVGWVYVHEHPAEFSKNWQNGTENYDRSAVMWVYLLAYRLAGIEAEHLVYFIIALEIIGLAWSYVRITQTLIDDAPASLAVVVAMLAVASSIRNVSLSRFGTPFFEGQFYTFAEIARNMAVLACLRGRWLKSAGWLSLATVNHVILGAIGSAFVAAVALVRWRGGERRDILRGAALLLLVGGAWLALFYQPGALYADPVPDAVWHTWARFFNYHWFPWHNGVFTAEHQRWLLPFLSMLAAAALCWLHPATRPPRYGREMMAGMAMLAAMTVFAVSISEQRVSTTLIKLALHRGADMMLTFALVYAVALWWRALVTLPAWRASAAAYLVLAASWSAGVASAALAVHGALAPPSARRDRYRWWLVATLPVLVALAYVVSGHGKPWLSEGYSGLAPLLGRPLLAVPLLLAVLVMLAARAGSAWRAPLLTLCVALACAGWIQRDVPHFAVEGRAYLDVQRWARANTPTGALFFADPTIFYGWSDYSRRASFGNLRDWTHRWAYNSRRDWWQQGVERLALLGLKVDPYLKRTDGAQRLTRDVRTRFYRADDAWRQRMASDWGVDYFVLRRKPAHRSQLPVVYQNQGFVVLAARAP